MKGEASRPCVVEEPPMCALNLDVEQQSRRAGVDERLDGEVCSLLLLGDGGA
jgi:hypothetical protein